MNIYVTKFVWDNGNKIEDDIVLKAFDTKEKAEAYLKDGINACKERLLKYYDEDDITIEDNEDCVVVDACYFEDCCTLSIVELAVE